MLMVFAVWKKHHWLVCIVGMSAGWDRQTQLSEATALVDFGDQITKIYHQGARAAQLTFEQPCGRHHTLQHRNEMRWDRIWGRSKNTLLNSEWRRSPKFTRAALRGHGLEDEVRVSERTRKEVTVVATMDSPGMRHTVGTLALNGTLDCWKWIAAFKRNGKRMRLDSAFEIADSNGSPRLIHVCKPGEDVPLHGILHRTHHLAKDGRFANIEDLHAEMRTRMPAA